jgi:hypothetical protein
MGNLYSSENNSLPVDELKEETNSANDTILDSNNNDNSTQTDDKLSEYQILKNQYDKLEIEKNNIQDELDNLKSKYEKLILKIDSEEIIKQIIKKIN